MLTSSLLFCGRYCGREHQVSDWKAHKARCKVIAADIAQAESHEIHKREFDRIRIKYGLDKDDKATEIAELLANTGANEGEFTLFANYVLSRCHIKTLQEQTQYFANYL